MIWDSYKTNIIYIKKFRLKKLKKTVINKKKKKNIIFFCLNK